jgi:hypothetical protein
MLVHRPPCRRSVGQRHRTTGTFLTDGHGNIVLGSTADSIRAACKEVEPGFMYALKDGKLFEHDLQAVLGKLLDLGKINMKDIRECFADECPFDDESDDPQELYRYKEWRAQRMKEQAEFEKRHWINL